MAKTVLHFLWKDRAATAGFRAGASLHSHTSYSWENLAWLSGYRSQFPGLSLVLKLARWQHHLASGEKLDLSRAFWTPPLNASAALSVEANQIRALGLPALVSLTDHDDLRSGLSLVAIRRSRKAAISLEWTVPFGSTFFHLGVHNLPAAHARETAALLAAYTTQPSASRLKETLDLLNESPETLIVLNHPLWDEAGLGMSEHANALRLFLACCRDWIHGLEFNGLRSWAENKQVLELAAVCGLPVVGGGDRHGLEPNAILNLTQAQTFPELVAEVRFGRMSHVLLMPQYREPLRLRWLETLKDIFRPYATAKGEVSRWKDRFFYQGEDGVRRPLSVLWQGTRADVLKPLFAFLRISESEQLKPALRFLLAERAGAIPA